MEHYFVLQIHSFYNEQIFSIIFKVTSIVTTIQANLADNFFTRYTHVTDNS